MSLENIYIGTSGWNYKHWRGTFYPKELAQKKWLQYYLDYFCSVEINNSFYQLPKAATFETWREAVPLDFKFAVKASRYMTHMKKLKDPQDAVTTFFERVKALEEKAAVILFQLPPRWKFNGDRLQNFIKMLPESYRYTFEFRDTSWWNDETYDILKSHNAAFCFYELAGTVTPTRETADFIYIRLHGPGAAYEGSYSRSTLEKWADRIRHWQNAGKQVYCYFDNDQNGYAPTNAAELCHLLT